MSVATISPEPGDHNAKIENLRQAIAHIQRQKRVATWKRYGLMILLLALFSYFLKGSSAFWIVAVSVLGRQVTLDAASARRLREAAVDVADLHDVKTLDALMDAWRLGNMGINSAIMNGLTHILTKLTTADRNWLKPADIHDLRLLVPMWDPDLGMAVLAAWEQVGDSNSLQAALKLASQPNRWEVKEPRRRPPNITAWAERMPEIAAEAERVAKVIEVRLEMERQQAVLLRPVGAMKQDSLLRPAIPTSSEPVEQLLRPSE